MYRMADRTLLSLDTRLAVDRDYADFTIPPPFSARVRNALNAEARSVRLSGLVGQGGLWYGFGRMLMRLYVPASSAHLISYQLSGAHRLNDIPAQELSDVLTKVRTYPITSPRVYNRLTHP